MNPLRIVMLGAPGSGKGTYSKAIAANIVKYLSPSTQAHTTLPVLSSGDLIRSEIAKQSDLGRAAQQAAGRAQGAQQGAMLRHQRRAAR